MPFDSEKQRRYLWANKPKVAKQIAKDEDKLKQERKLAKKNIKENPIEDYLGLEPEGSKITPEQIKAFVTDPKNALGLGALGLSTVALAKANKAKKEKENEGVKEGKKVNEFRQWPPQHHNPEKPMSGGGGGGGRSGGRSRSRSRSGGSYGGYQADTHLQNPAPIISPGVKKVATGAVAADTALGAITDGDYGFYAWDLASLPYKFLKNYLGTDSTQVDTDGDGHLPMIPKDTRDYETVRDSILKLTPGYSEPVGEQYNEEQKTLYLNKILTENSNVTEGWLGTLLGMGGGGYFGSHHGESEHNLMAMLKNNPDVMDTLAGRKLTSTGKMPTDLDQKAMWDLYGPQFGKGALGAAAGGFIGNKVQKMLTKKDKDKEKETEEQVTEGLLGTLIGGLGGGYLGSEIGGDTQAHINMLRDNPDALNTLLGRELSTGVVPTDAMREKAWNQFGPHIGKVAANVGKIGAGGFIGNKIEKMLKKKKKKKETEEGVVREASADKLFKKLNKNIQKYQERIEKEKAAYEKAKSEEMEKKMRQEEGFAGALPANQRNAFDNNRRRQSEVLGYKLTGKNDIKAEVDDATVKEEVSEYTRIMGFKK